MGRGRRSLPLVAALLAAALLASCASSGAPETRVRGASSVASARYPEPGSTRAANPFPVRAVPAGDRIAWVSRNAPAPVGTAHIDTRLEARIFVLGNRVREERGRSALALRGDLIDIARAHALDMAVRGYFSHHSPEGEGPGDRARRGGVHFGAFAENLARVRHSTIPADLAVKGWLDSAGHRRNLLDEKGVGYRYTGVGVAVAADGTVLLSQVFLR